MNRDEKLIELVKAHPAIYNKTDAFYSNKDYVKNLWQEIAQEMNQTVFVCQKRWRYLRDYFVRQLHMNQNIQNGTVITTAPVTTATTTTQSSSKSSVLTNTVQTTTATTPHSTNSESLKNSNSNLNLNLNQQKKKTFWALYHKMLFLKPFSSTRKAKRIAIIRRQSEGQFNNVLKSPSKKGVAGKVTDIDQNTVHTLSSSNSADEEFDSFDYMTMYQMQFGSEIDKSELRYNGRIATNIDINNAVINTNDVTQAQNESMELFVIPKSNSNTPTFAESVKITPSSSSSSSTSLSFRPLPQLKQIQKPSNPSVTQRMTASTEYFIAQQQPPSPPPPPPPPPPPSSSLPLQLPLLPPRPPLPPPLSSLSSSSQTPLQQPSETSQRPPKKRKKSELYEEILEILKRCNNDDLLDCNDEHAMFFRSILNSVRKIDEEHVLAFRTEILQIVMKYRYMSQQSDSDVVVVDTGEMHWRQKLPY